MTRTSPQSMPWPEWLRPTALRVVGAVIAILCAMGAARSQPAADADAIDPPGRVGSVSLLAGPVTMVDLASGSREDALLNWPVTAGWRIESGRTGRAEVRIGSAALRLDEDTTVDFVRLDDRFIQIAVLRGSVALRLRNREVLNELELLTQRERIVFDEIGRYRIDVDRTPGLTAITAFTGRVRIASSGSSFMIADGQRGELSAPPLISFQLLAALGDRFDDWAAARDARDDASRSAAYVSRETTGIETLDEYGDWNNVEEYGTVWFPRVVPPNWAPYRYGRWVWVGPWGWTWIDEAPWGFAPLHYGRWATVGGRWGWVPGVVVPRPVYAPALVAWFGAPGVSVRIGAPIGWFPLGPREVYVPAHRHTPRYLQVVNRQHVPGVAPITIVQTPKYVHEHPERSTWLPDDRFGRPEPVERGQRPPPSEWRQYIARPQPPANVPNTKRRQAAEGTAPPRSMATPVVPPASPVEARPFVRPPVVVPRPVEPQRAPEAPRVIETQRAQPAPSSRAVQPDSARGHGESPAANREDRHAAPRTPIPSVQKPPAVQTPPPGTPQAERTPHRGAPATAGQTPSAEVVPPGSRGDAGAARRDERRQAPRVPAPAPAAAPAPQATPPPVAPNAARDVGRPPPPARPAPPARQDGGNERGGERPGRPPPEVVR